MPLGAIIGGIGALTGLYGAKKNADAAKDIADAQDPYRVAAANAQFNFHDKYTPFGSVTYQQLPDGRFQTTQKYSPRMQELMDAMLGQAGAAPATYSSQMPQGLRNKMRDVYGEAGGSREVPLPAYQPSVAGFQQNRRPYQGQVNVGFNPANYTPQGEKVGSTPLIRDRVGNPLLPWQGPESAVGPGYNSDFPDGYQSPEHPTEDTAMTAPPNTEPSSYSYNRETLNALIRAMQNAGGQV